MFEPNGDRVLILPANPADKSSGGLVLSKLENDKQDQGEVVAVGMGEGVKWYHVGDVLVYEKYGPASVTIDEKEYVIVHSDQILGRLKDKWIKDKKERE